MNTAAAFPQRRSTPPLLQLLWGASLAVGAVLAWLWLWPGQQAGWQPPAPHMQNIQALQPAQPALAGAWKDWQNLILEIQERPLFVLGRRPPPPPPKAEEAPKADEWDRAVLLGTYSAAQTSGAFLLLDGQPQRMVLGQQLGGWTLQTVHPQSIELQRADKTRQLTVQKKDISQPSAAPAQGQSRAAPATSPFAITPPAAPAEPAAQAQPSPEASRPQPARSRHAVGGSR